MVLGGAAGRNPLRAVPTFALCCAACTDQLARNACLSVDLAGKSDSIVVVQGQDHPLMREYGGASGIAIHGDDGLGNTARPFKTSLKPMQHKHKSAARYLVDTCAAHPGEITLITLGPLTNIAVRGHCPGGPALQPLTCPRVPLPLPRPHASSTPSSRPLLSAW